MSKVFISHSSLDKKFIEKLAVDLTVRGIPVWYDSWEMEAGDKLYDRIFDGVDESSLIVLALSPASITSKWVGKELNAAIAKEDRLGRKAIIPIIIADCVAPLVIADRIYADFSQNYLSAVEMLEKVIRKSIGSALSTVAVDKQLIALTFSRGLFLDAVGLQKQFQRLAPAIRAGGKVTAEQIVIAPDHRLDAMRNVLLRTIESYEDDKHYSHGTEHFLKDSYERLMKAETALIDGIADIANGIVKLDSDCFAHACHWYGRIIRNEILAKLVATWQLSKPSEVPPLGEGVVLGPISSNTGAAEFFGTKAVELVDIFQRNTDEYFKAWIGEETEPFREARPFRQRLFHFWSPDLIYKYIVPQMVANYRFYNAPRAKSYWALPDMMIGSA